MCRTFAAALFAASMLAGAGPAHAMGAGGGGGMGGAGTNYGTSTMPNYMPPSDTPANHSTRVKHRHSHKHKPVPKH